MIKNITFKITDLLINMYHQINFFNVKFKPYIPLNNVIKPLKLYNNYVNMSYKFPWDSFFLDSDTNFKEE